MVFQSEVTSAVQAVGNAGQVCKAHHSFLNIDSYFAEDNIEIGEFAQSSLYNDNQAKSTKNKKIDGIILGVVIRDNFINSYNNQPSNVLAKGSNLNIINCGSVFIESDKIANFGDFVLLDKDSGEVIFSKDKELAGYIAAGWQVFLPNKIAGRGIVGITTAGIEGFLGEMPELDDIMIVWQNDTHISLKSRYNRLHLIGEVAEWRPLRN